jgi:hypothetical protein
MDDAVFSLGEFISLRPNTLIITPFAGLPDDDIGEAKYKRLYIEHELVCEAMEATWINGPFLDDVYAATRDLTGLRDWIYDMLYLNDVHEAWVPYGIFHVDHKATAAAGFAAANLLNIDLCIYEELPYRVLWPEEVKPTRMLVGATLQGPALNLTRKKELCAMYASQTQGDDIHRCLYAPERLWRVR